METEVQPGIGPAKPAPPAVLVKDQPPPVGKPPTEAPVDISTTPEAVATDSRVEVKDIQDEIDLDYVNRIIDSQITRLDEELLEAGNPDRIVQLVSEASTLRLARLCDDKSKLGIYGKYLALRKYTNLAQVQPVLARLAGDGKTAGLMQGWRETLDSYKEIPGLATYFEENGLEAFVSLTTINELHAISAGQPARITEAIEVLKRTLRLPGKGMDLLVDMQEGTVARQLFEQKAVLDQVSQMVYGKSEVRLSGVIDEIRGSLSSEAKANLKRKFKDLFFSKIPAVGGILFLLAIMMSTEGEQGGGQPTH